MHDSATLRKDFALPRVNYREAGQPHPGGGGVGGVGGLARWVEDRPQLPYLIPFMAYVLLMAPATFGTWGGVAWEPLWRQWHPLIYCSQNLLAALLLWCFWDYYAPIRWNNLGLGVVVGLLGTIVWVGVEYICQRAGLGALPDPTKFYNPDLILSGTAQRWAYLCIRVVGPTLVVPVMEELFFRDFLLRALVRGARFEDVPVATFTWFSLIAMSLLFGINHGAEWPEGILYGLMMGILLIRTKSLGSCIVAHAVTNWSLYLYVIYRGDWQFM